jgi:hypothetical protein
MRRSVCSTFVPVFRSQALVLCVSDTEFNRPKRRDRIHESPVFLQLGQQLFELVKLLSLLQNLISELTMNLFLPTELILEVFAVRGVLDSGRRVCVGGHGGLVKVYVEAHNNPVL